MSRSLDAAVLDAIKTEDPKPVYADIAAVFAAASFAPGIDNGNGAGTDTDTDTGLLELEILGREFPLDPGVNLLRDGLAIAVPKLRLAQAFVVARQLLGGHLDGSAPRPPGQLLQATSVLLLMDPEHLTAANTRKRCLLAAGLERKEAADALQGRERHFVDSLLTSRLHRHTKSPTLWSHRRWLLQTFGSGGGRSAAQLREDITAVVMVAAERHPRNYYAWNHARWLVSLSPPQGRVDLLDALIADTTAWCLRHPSDISGWDYLAFLIESLAACDGERGRAACGSVLSEVLRLAQSFRWTNESVWVFLRTVVAGGSADKGHAESFRALNEKLSAALAASSPERETLKTARQWCDEHRESR